MDLVADASPEAFATRLASIPVPAQVAVCRRILPRLTVARHAAHQGQLASVAGTGVTGSGLLLLISATGQAEVHCGKRTLPLGDGQALLLPGVRAAAARLLAGCVLYALSLDGERGVAAGPDASDEAPARTVSAGDPVVHLLVGYCEQLLALEDLPPPLARVCCGQLRELATRLCDPTGDLVRSAPYAGRKAARLRAVLLELHRDFRDPSLSAARVAGRLGLTPRYVQALMDGAGASFSAYLRNLRLDEALRLLQDAATAHRPIADIAFEVGFQDLSYFNRVFRRRTCRTPSQVRREA